MIGTATATVALSGTTTEANRSRFALTDPAAATRSTVAFASARASGPRGELFYKVGGHPFAPHDLGTCPVRQTEDTQPPLCTVRRHGIAVTIRGAR